MAEREYRPVAHDHDEFLARAMKRKGFAAAHAQSADEYELVRELLAARAKRTAPTRDDRRRRR